jgi:hypothetical protein
MQVSPVMQVSPAHLGAALDSYPQLTLTLFLGYCLNIDQPHKQEIITIWTL